MSLYALYFSPTGGTKKAVQALVEHFDAVEIDLSCPEEDYSQLQFTPEDVCFVAVPSFAGRVPAIATNHIGQLSGGGAKAVCVVVYGNRAFDDTMAELQGTLEKGNFVVVAGVGAIAEHSIARQYATGRPNQKDCQELAAFGREIMEKSVPLGNSISLPGTFPTEPLKVNSLKPKANKDCNQCGLCATLCPAQAISATDLLGTPSSQCFGCMRCVAVCPQQARKVNVAVTASVGLMLKKACTNPKNNQLFC